MSAVVVGAIGDVVVGNGGVGPGEEAGKMTVVGPPAGSVPVRQRYGGCAPKARTGEQGCGPEPERDIVTPADPATTTAPTTANQARRCARPTVARGPTPRLNSPIVRRRARCRMELIMACAARAGTSSQPEHLRLCDLSRAARYGPKVPHRWPSLVVDTRRPVIRPEDPPSGRCDRCSATRPVAEASDFLRDERPITVRIYRVPDQRALGFTAP